jgi:putative membrane protein
MLDILIILSPVFIVPISKRIRVSLDLITRLLLALFLASAMCLSISFLLYGKGSGVLGLVGGYYMPLAFAFVTLQLYNSLKLRKTVVFIAVTWTFGLVSEWLGASYGLVFGHYYYNLTPFYFGSVPLMTPFSWVIIIYFSFGMTNLLFGCQKGFKSGFRRHRLPMSLVVIPAILASIDAIAAMNLDLLLDPVSVAPEVAGWVWIGGGPFFGVPISNFIGWFLVAFFAMFIFRAYCAAGNQVSPTLVSASFGAPLMYFVYLLIHSSLAIGIGRSEFALIGAGAMSPFLLLSLLCYVKKVAPTEPAGGLRE